MLRFLALYFYGDQYERPMGEFLTKFAKKYQRANTSFLSQAERVFSETIKLAYQSLNGKAFRPDRVLNAALFDAVMVDLARRLTKGAVVNFAAVKEAYNALLLDKAFVALVSQHTSDDSNVKQRLQKATTAFADV